MINGYIYLIETEGMKMAGRYDASINAIRNLKKKTLYCSVLPEDKILGEWRTLKEYKTLTV